MRISALVSLSLLGLAALGCSAASNVPEAAEVADAAPALAALSDQIGLTEIAMFQAVKATIWKDGARVATPNAPVVAGRPGLLRVYVQPKPGWKPRMLAAKLRVVANGKELASIVDQRTIRKMSSDDAIDSTFLFHLPAEAIVEGAQYALDIGDASSVTPALSAPGSSIGWPTDGSLEDLGAKGGTETLRLKLVPVRYDADGSGRLPSTTPDQIQLYEDTLYKLYPTAKVEVTVRDPMPWTTPITGDGTGWDDLLTAVMSLRAQDAPPDDVYYVGAFEPSPSLSQFCARGCTLGLAMLAGPTAVSQRAVAVVGYDGDEGPNTLTQELAHAMGRAHAPCGNPDMVDRKFPYSDGSIGTWGYDLGQDELRDPLLYKDMMSYCQPIWISDYSFAAIFDRMVTVNLAAKQSATSGASGTMAFRAVHLGPDGALRRGRAVRIPTEGLATITAEIQRADGTRATMQVPWIATDGKNGGFALVPEGESTNAIRLTREGVAWGELAAAR